MNINALGRPTLTGQYSSDGPVLKLDNWSTVEELGSIYIVGYITNISDMYLTEVLVEFLTYDASGNRIDSPSSSIFHLNVGETWKFIASVYRSNEVDKVKFLRMGYLPKQKPD
jgi:hypothetical protein